MGFFKKKKNILILSPIMSISDLTVSVDEYFCLYGKDLNGHREVHDNVNLLNLSDIDIINRVSHILLNQYNANPHKVKKFASEVTKYINKFR